MRYLLPACVLLALLSARADAGSIGPGVALRWGQCYGDAGIQSKEFACDVNTGLDRLVASFELGSAISGVYGVAAYLHIASVSANLPQWWTFTTAGAFGCRSTALRTELTPPAGSVSCGDWSNGLALGGVDQYLVGQPSGPNHVRIRFVAGLQFPVDLTAGQEYFAMALTVLHTKTVGSSCTGCLEPATICLSGIDLNPGTAPFGAGADLRLTTGVGGTDSRWVSWQHSHPINLSEGCTRRTDHGDCYQPVTLFDAAPDAATPACHSTWQQVKSLYR